MLRNLIIIKASGLVLFEKDWKLDKKKAISLGGLIKGIQEFCQQSVGLPLSYLEFSSMAVTFVEILGADNQTIICALLHDVADGVEFGRLIATQILQRFLSEYFQNNISAVPNPSTGNRSRSGSRRESGIIDAEDSAVLNQNMFRATFSNKIMEIISNSPRAILYQLEQVRGIEKVVLYDERNESKGLVSVQTLEDQLGLAANLQALISFSSEILARKGDSIQQIVLEMNGFILFVDRVVDYFLLCICNKSIDQQVYQYHINNAVLLLTKVFQVVHENQS